MINIVGVRFKTSSRIYYFDPGEFQPVIGDIVLVETSMGEEEGKVVLEPQAVSINSIVQPIKSLLRIIETDSDEEAEEKKANARDAMIRASEVIERHGLDMKLVDAEYGHCGGKVTFYFTSDGRVDFRNLVKELAGVFRMRIELRQIGVRDEARMIGGLGCCGREVCCKSFLKEFEPVSIKMAKEQSLSLNPTKISGICGRLMCCLQYEQDTYQQLKKELPKYGAKIFTPEGQGTVIDVQIIAERVKVKVFKEDNSFEIYSFKASEISTTNPVPLREKEKTASEQQFDLGLKEMGLGEFAVDNTKKTQEDTKEKVPYDKNKKRRRKKRPATPQEAKTQSVTVHDKNKTISERKGKELTKPDKKPQIHNNKKRPSRPIKPENKKQP